MTLHTLCLFAFFHPFKTIYRFDARRQARRSIAEVDAVGDDWEAADVLWQYIEAWMNANPMHCAEFLRLFRAHHLAKPFSTPVESEPYRVRHVI
jgi:hypothetical protein